MIFPHWKQQKYSITSGCIDHRRSALPWVGQPGVDSEGTTNLDAPVSKGQVSLLHLDARDMTAINVFDCFWMIFQNLKVKKSHQKGRIRYLSPLPCYALPIFHCKKCHQEMEAHKYIIPNHPKIISFGCCAWKIALPSDQKTPLGVPRTLWGSSRGSWGRNSVKARRCCKNWNQWNITCFMKPNVLRFLGRQNPSL